jgi:hypothetical protein
MCFVSLQGHDTTSAGISWALYLLGLHPDVQVYNDIAIFTGTKNTKRFNSRRHLGGQAWSTDWILLLNICIFKKVLIFCLKVDDNPYLICSL